MSFSTRMKTLNNLSLTTPSLRSLILSSPEFWSKVEINIIKDVTCSPPLSFLKELFGRSGQVKMSVRVAHWGDEYEYFNRNCERIPGVTREVRKLLEEHGHRLEHLCLEFHHLNGTEYASRGWKGGDWPELKRLELYASDWATVHSLPTGWVESALASASPETVIIRGSGAFRWSALGKDMSRLKKLRIECDVPESLGAHILSRTPALEDCQFNQITQMAQRGHQSRGGATGRVELAALRRLHVGSVRCVGQFLNMVTAPRLFQFEINYVETKKAQWDQEAFSRFVCISGLGSTLKKLVIRRGAMSQENMKDCVSMFGPGVMVEMS